MPKESVEEREKRADFSSSSEELETLAKDEDSDVRFCVARNSNTPSQVLDKLAEDEDSNVRGSVAENPNTPSQVLDKLAEDENSNVRWCVAGNPNTPSQVLDKLAEDEDEDVRNEVAENENASTSALEKQTATDDKAKTLQLESFEETVEKINNWISESDKPTRCTSDYIVWENEREDGTFTVEKDGKPEEIEGYIIWENKSSVILKWELPDSAQEAIATLERKEWSDEEIEYDDSESSGSSEGKSSQDFDEKGNTIESYVDFDGGGVTEVINFGSSFGPSDISISYENDQKVVFESSDGGSWTVKTADGKPETIPNYEEVLKLVRKLLGTPE